MPASAQPAANLNHVGQPHDVWRTLAQHPDTMTFITYLYKAGKTVEVISPTRLRIDINGRPHTIDLNRER